MLGSEDDAWQHAFDTQAVKHHELLEKRAGEATGGMTPDDGNLFASLLFGVYQAPPTTVQPFITHIAWQVLETITGVRHLIGQSMQDRDVRVSTRAARWNPASRTAITDSGRRYHLDGLPSRDAAAFAVFDTWAIANSVETAECVNVSAEYAPVAIDAQTVARVPCETLHHSSAHVALGPDPDDCVGDWILLYCEDQLNPVGAIIVAPTENDSVWVVNPRPWHQIGFTGDAFWTWWNERIVDSGIRDRLLRGEPDALGEIFLLSGIDAKVTSTAMRSAPERSGSDETNKRAE